MPSNGNLVPEINHSAPVRRMPDVLVVAVVSLMASPHPDIPRQTGWSDGIRDYAKAHLESMGRDLAPADAALLTKWLLPIAAGVGNTPTEDDFKRRVGALELGAATLPALVFNAATQRLGLTTWRFMPSVAEVVELVTAAHRHDLDWIAAVRTIALA